MSNWISLAEGYPESGRRFIALYSDGSGARMFYRYDDGMIDQDGDDEYIDDIDNGSYFYWSYLPDNFKMWCEERYVDPIIIVDFKEQKHV